MWHASPNTMVSPRRRGSAYIMVLVLGIILAVIGAASVAVSRGTMRTMTDSRDWGEAQSLAFSGVEHALLKLNQDSNWRTTFSGQTCQKSLGNGTFSWRLVDEIDGNLANDATQKFVILSTGTVRNATYTHRVSMTPATTGNLVYGVFTPTTIGMSSSSVVDSYDSGLGTYGKSNRGSSANVATNTTATGGVSLTTGSQIRGNVQVGMGGNPSTVISPPTSVTGTKTALTQAATLPTLTAPTNTGTDQGSVKYPGNQTTVVSSNVHCTSLEIKSNATIQIQGDVTIYVEGDVSIWHKAGIEILPNSSLKLYFTGGMDISKHSDCIVDGANLSRLQYISLGTSPITLGDDSSTQGVIIAPYAPVQMSGEFQLYGAVVAKSVTMTDASVHQDKRITNGTDPVTLGPTKPRVTGWSQVVN